MSRRMRGFTLIELVVVLAVISLLVALLAPAVLATRESSRRMDCRSRLRGVGLGLIANADSQKRFVAAGNFGPNDSGQLAPFHSWVVNVLPWIDQPALAAKWNWAQPYSHASNAEFAKAHVPLLTCPSDVTLTIAGDLSYGVNAGFAYTTLYNGVSDCPVTPGGAVFDFNGDGVTCATGGVDGEPTDKELFFQTGLFFVENYRMTGGTVRHYRPDEITDGRSQTLLLAENVRLGVDPLREHTNWANPVSTANGFFVPAAVCKDGVCTAGGVDYARANSPPHGINSGVAEAEGQGYYPSSFHPGGVNAVFVDGHAAFLSEQIDGRVFAALASPQGGKITTALRQGPVSDSDF